MTATRSITIILPWPERALSPNARNHWSITAAAKKNARAIAHVRALEANARMLKGAPRAHVTIAFAPPTAARRDLDNMIGSMKAAFDGIASAAGIDDSRWTLSASVIAPVKGGCVSVIVEAVE